MSQNESKMISEREAVLRERAAWIDGVRVGVIGLPWKWDGEDAEAARRYALPKVTRPRVVADPHEYGYWKAKDGDVLNAETPDAHEWVLCGNYGLRLTAERVKLWSDLLANPTEEVDADA